MDARKKSIAAQGLLITGACPFISAACVGYRKVSIPFFPQRSASAAGLQNDCA